MTDSSKAQKVREFWFNDGRVFTTEDEAVRNFGEVFRTIYPVHTIEYSAYQQIEKERDEVKTLLAEALKDKKQILEIGVEMQRETNKKLSKELEIVKAQLEKRKVHIFDLWDRGSHLEWPHYEKALEEDLTEIRQEMSK